MNRCLPNWGAAASEDCYVSIRPNVPFDFILTTIRVSQSNNAKTAFDLAVRLYRPRQSNFESVANFRVNLSRGRYKCDTPSSPREVGHKKPRVVIRDCAFKDKTRRLG